MIYPVKTVVLSRADQCSGPSPCTPLDHRSGRPPTPLSLCSSRPSSIAGHYPVQLSARVKPPCRPVTNLGQSTYQPIGAPTRPPRPGAGPVNASANPLSSSAKSSTSDPPSAGSGMPSRGSPATRAVTHLASRIDEADAPAADADDKSTHRP